MTNPDFIQDRMPLDSLGNQTHVFIAETWDIDSTKDFAKFGCMRRVQELGSPIGFVLLRENLLLGSRGQISYEVLPTSETERA